ncbi:Alpha/Beta hydrolase protein, partial [Dichotomocladium elegans]
PTHFHELDLYIPEGAWATSPLVVFVHGGAWRSEDKADHAPLANALAAKGYPVAVPNYRQVEGQPPSVQHPMHIEDILEAVLYLAQTFQSDAYDPSAIYLVGHSAGGHIVSSLMLDTNFAAKLQPHVRGVITAAGIHDIPLILKMYPDYLDFIAQAFGQDRTCYADASPVTKSPDNEKTPPFLVINSLEDKLIDVNQGKALVDHLQSV